MQRCINVMPVVSTLMRRSLNVICPLDEQHPMNVIASQGQTAVQLQDAR